ncbi:hypothetical protein TWF481_002987 [Arthrobotrys musiformis]|uniref:Uncharacterized protein n=1 Tax=Arthrobotrys musiformis TaxID=47236 RepID=A0AAV9VRU3_9PEZI
MVLRTSVGRRAVWVGLDGVGEVGDTFEGGGCERVVVAVLIVLFLLLYAGICSRRGIGGGALVYEVIALHLCKSLYEESEAACGNCTAEKRICNRTRMRAVVYPRSKASQLAVKTAALPKSAKEELEGDDDETSSGEESSSGDKSSSSDESGSSSDNSSSKDSEESSSSSEDDSSSEETSESSDGTGTSDSDDEVIDKGNRLAILPAVDANSRLELNLLKIQWSATLFKG